MKTLLVILLFLTGIFANVQAYSRYGTEHELKFNIDHFLVNTTIERSYEYYFTEDTSIGDHLF